MKRLYICACYLWVALAFWAGDTWGEIWGLACMGVAPFLALSYEGD